MCSLIMLVLFFYELYIKFYPPLPPILAGLFVSLLFDAMARAKVEIQAGQILIDVGILATLTIPLEIVERIDLVDHLFLQGVGIRACGRGEIGIITNWGKAVRLHLTTRHRLNLFHLLPLSFERIRLSLEDPGRFIEATRHYLREVGKGSR